MHAFHTFMICMIYMVCFFLRKNPVVLYKKAATVATIATMAAIFFDDALDADGQVPQQPSALIFAEPAALTVICPSEPQHVPVVRPLQSHASDFMQDIAPVFTAPPHVLALPQ